MSWQMKKVKCQDKDIALRSFFDIWLMYALTAKIRQAENLSSVRNNIKHNNQYDERSMKKETTNLHKNRLLESGRKLLFQKIKRKIRQNELKPNTVDRRTAWCNIWSQNVKDVESADWINESKKV